MSQKDWREKMRQEMTTQAMAATSPRCPCWFSRSSQDPVWSQCCRMDLNFSHKTSVAFGEIYPQIQPGRVWEEDRWFQAGLRPGPLASLRFVLLKQFDLLRPKLTALQCRFITAFPAVKVRISADELGMRTGRVSHVYYTLYYFRCLSLRNSLTTFGFILREHYFKITGFVGH